VVNIAGMLTTIIAILILAIIIGAIVYFFVIKPRQQASVPPSVQAVTAPPTPQYQFILPVSNVSALAQYNNQVVQVLGVVGVGDSAWVLLQLPNGSNVYYVNNLDLVEGIGLFAPGLTFPVPALIKVM